MVHRMAPGSSNILLKQMKKKFGPLPEGTSELVLSAELPELERWSIRALSAWTVSDVMDP